MSFGTLCKNHKQWEGTEKSLHLYSAGSKKWNSPFSPLDNIILDLQSLATKDGPPPVRGEVSHKRLVGKDHWGLLKP